MTDIEIRDFYETNNDFKEYCDKELKIRQLDNPAITIDDILEYKIIKEVANYYKEKPVNQ
jgi:hypothetical protein